MNLNKEFNWNEVLFDSSKQVAEFGIKLVINEPELFPSLLELALKQNSKYSQRAARVVCYSIERRGDLFGHHSTDILSQMEKITNESIKFNLLRVFTVWDLPEDEIELGKLADLCFNAVEAKVERIAVKVYAIEILYRISQIFPELKPELIHLFGKYTDNASPAYLCRAARLLNKLNKEIGYIVEEE